jgi:hypothetical protein
VQTGIFGASSLSVESRQAYCAGFREENAGTREPVDRISIQGMGEGTTAKNNPHFLAVLEERVVSFVV